MDVSLHLQAQDRFSPDREGLARLTLRKDRFGRLGVRNDVVAEMHVSLPFRIDLRPPGADTRSVQPGVSVRQVVEHVAKENDEGRRVSSKRQIVGALGGNEGRRYREIAMADDAGLIDHDREFGWVVTAAGLAWLEESE